MLCSFNSLAINPEREQQLRDRIVTTAESQLHVREATGHNDGPDVQKYLKVTGLKGNYPWCAAFVSWVFEQSGAQGPRSARVVDWFKHNIVYLRTWKQTPINPEKGMLIGLYYSKLGRFGHIGIIADRPPTLPGIPPRHVITIEGNTNQAGSREGQGVYKKIRPWKSIAVMSDYCVLGKSFKRKYSGKRPAKK